MKMKEYYCPKCKWKLPTEKNVVTMGMHILNKCFSCGSKLWDGKGNFLGEIKITKSKFETCKKCGKLKIPFGTIVIDYEDFPCMCD